MQKKRWTSFVAAAAAALALVTAIAACLGDAPQLATIDGASSPDAADDAPVAPDAPDADLDGAPSLDAGPLDAPRPIAPLSTSTVTSQTPSLRWALPAGVDEVLVEICADRACTKIEHSIKAAGASTKPPTALSPGVHFWRVRARKGDALASRTSPTWEMFVGYRSAPRDLSWGTVPDFDGDGVAEVAIGSFYGAEVRLFAGGAAAGAYVSLANPDVDGGRGERFARVASAGDMDGDGYPELVVGAFGYSGPGPGRVYLYEGGPGGIAANAAPSATISSPASAEANVTEFGASVASAGDVDGDGYGDLVVGASRILTDRDGGGRDYGGVFVFYGGPTAVTSGPTRMSKLLDGSGNSLYFGTRVASAGDVNGDGYADIVASGDLYDVDNFVVYGGDGGVDGLVAGRYMTLTPPDDAVLSNGESALTVLSPTPGDLDGDGLSDVVMGDPSGPVVDGGAGAGRVVVYRGRVDVTPSAATDGQIVAPAGASGFGYSVAIAGDSNADGFDDLVVGAPTAPGTMHWYPGASGGIGVDAARHVALPAPATFTTDPDGNAWGYGVAGVGDFDGDRVADVAGVPAYGEGIFVFGGSSKAGGAGIDPARWTRLALTGLSYGPSIAMQIVPVPSPRRGILVQRLD